MHCRHLEQKQDKKLEQFTVFNNIFKAIKRVKCKFIVACFDTKAPTFRHEMFKDYKAQRPMTLLE